MINYFFLNWKNYLTIEQSIELANWIANVKLSDKLKHLAIFPSAIMAYPIKNIIVSSGVELGLQKIDDDFGKVYTGAIGLGLARELGVSYCLVGHSEQRLYDSFDDKKANALIKSLANVGVRPVLCVGESEEVYNSGGSLEYVIKSIRASCDGFTEFEKLIIAYEPVWAIGGQQTADISHVENMIKAIRLLPEFSSVPVLYGGSVSEISCRSFIHSDLVNGLLVGSASTKIETLSAMLKFII